MHTCVLVADDRNIYVALDRFTNYDHDEPKPDSRWDYFGIGGHFEGMLVLKRPRRIRRLFGLLPGRVTTRASVAKKFEIDQGTLLSDPPAALFFAGNLYECPMFAEGEALARWQTEFRERFSEVPNDTTLQVVDAHS